MITINGMVIPGGIGMLRSDLFSGSINTSDCGNYHDYNILVDDVDRYRGRIPKLRSGHRNIIRLLNDVTGDILANS